MLQLLDAFRPTALPALLFLLGLPLFLLLKPGAARAFFSVAGAVALSVAGGVELAGGLIAAIVAGYLVVEGLARVRGANRAVYAIAWILLHVAYLACFQLPLPGAFQPPHLRAADGPGTFLFFSGIAVTFFRLLSYAHARLRGGAARLELADYLAYMLFFPQFRHGPLERGPDFAPRLRSARERWTRRDVGAGLLRVALGIGGVVVAGALGTSLVRSLPVQFRAAPFAVLTHPDELSLAQVLLMLHGPAALLYLLESGFASVQLGVSRAFGVVGTENFRFPFLATNPRDVWHRWNITLSAWLRDFAYVPLGGRQRRHYLNVVLVFLYCGLLHGPQLRCLAWGLWSGGTLAGYLWLRELGGRRSPAATAPRRGRVWDAVVRTFCRLATFHWFSIGVTIILDPEYCGLRVLQRYIHLLVTLGG